MKEEAEIKLSARNEQVRRWAEQGQRTCMVLHYVEAGERKLKHIDLVEWFGPWDEENARPNMAPTE